MLKNKLFFGLALSVVWLISSPASSGSLKDWLSGGGKPAEAISRIPSGVADQLVDGGLASHVEIVPFKGKKPVSPDVVVKAGSSSVLDLQVGKSRLIEIPETTRDIMVSNSSIAEIRMHKKGLAYLMAGNVGETNVLFLDDAGQIAAKADIHVHLDTDKLQDSISSLFPSAKVNVKAVRDTVILAGQVGSSADASNIVRVARQFVEADERIINMLSVDGEQQVLLKVKVAEMNRSAVKDLGLRTGLQRTFNGSSWVFNLTQPAEALSAGGLGASNLYTGSIGRGGNLDIDLSAYEREGIIKTLAEPNLTAVSGEKADLLAGGEYPIPVFNDQGQVTFFFRPYGISLSFRPVVLSSGLISLKVSTEVSSIAGEKSIAGSTVPELSTRRFGTTVEMGSGGSLMIAGLLQNDASNSFSGLPGAMDLPIIGALFRSNAFKRNETELVVIIHAYLVNPQDPETLSMPTDGFAPAGDLDRLLFANLYQTYRAGPGMQPPKGVVEGPIGYIVK